MQQRDQWLRVNWDGLREASAKENSMALQATAQLWWAVVFMKKKTASFSLPLECQIIHLWLPSICLSQPTLGRCFTWFISWSSAASTRAVANHQKTNHFCKRMAAPHHNCLCSAYQNEHKMQLWVQSREHPMLCVQGSPAVLCASTSRAWLLQIICPTDTGKNTASLSRFIYPSLGQKVAGKDKLITVLIPPSGLRMLAPSGASGVTAVTR